MEAHRQLMEMSDAHIEHLTHRFTDEQPYLAALLLTAFEEQLRQEEQEWLFLSAVMLWYAVILHQDKLGTVPDKVIDRCEEANQPLFKYLEGEEPEGLEENIDTILEDYPQDDLLAAGLDVLFDDEENEQPISEHNAALLFITLKTFTDALTMS